MDGSGIGGSQPTAKKRNISLPWKDHEVCHLTDAWRRLPLYRVANMIVFPSLSEGFGLPVLESVACGTPVVTSNVTSIPEVAGDAVLLVNPLDVDQIAEAMAALLTDNSLRTSLIERELERARTFSWEVAV